MHNLLDRLQSGSRSDNDRLARTHLEQVFQRERQCFEFELIGARLGFSSSQSVVAVSATKHIDPLNTVSEEASVAMHTTSPSAHEEAREKFGHQCAFGVSTCVACFFFGASPILRAFRAVRPACFLRTELALFDALFSPAKLPVTVKPSAVSAARNAFCLRPVTIHAPVRRVP